VVIRGAGAYCLGLRVKPPISRRSNRIKPSRLARFLRALHVEAPADAPKNNLRGVPLRQRAAAIEDRMQRLEQKTKLVTADIRKAWQSGVQAAEDEQPTWIHGDLHARNILVEDGSISGVIDWGIWHRATGRRIFLLFGCYCPVSGLANAQCQNVEPSPGQCGFGPEAGRTCSPCSSWTMAWPTTRDTPKWVNLPFAALPKGRTSSFPVLVPNSFLSKETR
jgi:hypothetical protein